MDEVCSGPNALNFATEVKSSVRFSARGKSISTLYVAEVALSEEQSKVPSILR